VSDKLFGAQLLEYFDRKDAGFLAFLQNEAMGIEAYARAAAPWTDRTGNARAGIQGGAEMKGRKTFVLYLRHSMEYGIDLERGTPPHLIRPKDKKALSWPGAAHPVKVVHHPGTRPRPIIGPALMDHLDSLKKGVVDYWRDEKK
jgi:hypothetical protein